MSNLPESPPVLLACAHGTRNPDGGVVMTTFRDAVGDARPSVPVERAYLDIQEPSLPDVVAALAAAGRRMVVVPLLLSAGYHVHVDIAAAVAAAGGLAVATPPLGPDPVLAAVVDDRLTRVGAGPADAVVLAAAGSSDPRALADVERVASFLAARRPAGLVSTAYLSAASPRVDEAVAAARARSAAPVSIGTYLLAPGLFADRLPGMGADRVSAPMAPDPRLVDLVLARYDTAVHSAGW